MTKKRSKQAEKWKEVKNVVTSQNAITEKNKQKSHSGISSPKKSQVKIKCDRSVENIKKEGLDDNGLSKHLTMTSTQPSKASSLQNDETSESSTDSSDSDNPETPSLKKFKPEPEFIDDKKNTFVSKSYVQNNEISDSSSDSSASDNPAALSLKLSKPEPRFTNETTLMDKSSIQNDESNDSSSDSSDSDNPATPSLTASKAGPMFTEESNSTRKRKHIGNEEEEKSAMHRVKNKKKTRTEVTDAAKSKSEQETPSRAKHTVSDDSSDDVEPNLNAVSQKKVVSYEVPDKQCLSDYVDGQLWAEDVKDSELWLVKLPSGFDVNSLTDAHPIPDASVEVCRTSSKTNGTWVVEMETSQSKTLEESSYSVLLPSKQTRAPVSVGKFVGEIQVTKHVVTDLHKILQPRRKHKHLPEGLKMRHMPFGADGPIPRLDRSGHVLDALQRNGHISDGDIEKLQYLSKKRNQKKRKLEAGDVMQNMDKDIDDTDSSYTKKKKKKKKNKNKDLEESLNTSMVSLDNIKQDDTVDHIKQEDAMADIKQNDPMDNIKQEDAVAITDTKRKEVIKQEDKSLDEPLTKSKKKKKHKYRKMDANSVEVSVKTESLLDSPNVSVKTESVEMVQNVDSPMADNITDTLSVSKAKKKKKKHKEADLDIKLDSSVRVKEEILDSSVVAKQEKTTATAGAQAVGDECENQNKTKKKKKKKVKEDLTD